MAQNGRYYVVGDGFLAMADYYALMPTPTYGTWSSPEDMTETSKRMAA